MPNLSIFVLIAAAASVRKGPMTSACTLRSSPPPGALAQAQAATEAAWRAARPARPVFALGFLTGQEMDWLPEAMRVLHDVLPEIEVTVSSQYSPLLGEALTKGRLDLAFMRAEPGMPDLTYQLVAEESLVAVLLGQSSARHR